MKFLRRYWGLVLLLLLSLFSVPPLFHPGFFPMHDDTQVVRVYEMAQALRDGQFPVRWVADLGYGYGYPIFNFYSPLPYYVGGFFNLISFDTLVATKIMFALGILLSGILMYFLVREFFGEAGGVVAGLFYLYAPYHALDIYVRGAVGEFWAMAFLPLMVWGLYKVAVDPRSAGLWVAVGALGFTGVILSHNLTAMMVTPVLAIVLLFHCFIAYKSKKLPPTPYTLYPFFLALGLSAFYWLPAIFEMGYTNVAAQIGGGADFRDHFVCLGQLWNSPWGFGGSAPGCLDGMSFKIGKIHVVMTTISLVLVIFWWRKERFKTALILLSTFYFLLSTFLTTEYSKSIWEAIPQMAYIQYPWRFLIFVTFTTSFLAGSIFGWLKNNPFKLMACGLLLIILLFYNIKLFQPQKYLAVGAQDYLTEENIKWKTSKISDEYLPRDFPKPTSFEETVKEKLISRATLLEIKIKSNKYLFKTNAKDEELVLVQTAYFPGWQVFVDNKKVDFETKKSLISFMLPQGEHQVEVVFKETPLRVFANLLTLVSFVILLGGLKYGSKTKG